MFKAAFYKNNRINLLTCVDADCIVVTAAGLLQKSADTSFSFKQDTHFLYLTGLSLPDYVLVITNNQHYLVAPKRDAHRDVWEGSVDVGSLQVTSGVDAVLSYYQGQKLLRTLVQNKVVGMILPAKSYVSAYGMYTNPARSVLYRRIKRCGPKQVIDIRSSLGALRQIKTDDEIAAIQQAVHITKVGIDYVKKHIKKVHNERDIEHMLTYSFGMNGATGHAYQPIIASDGNATTIHYVSNNAPLDDATTVLFDVGAEYNNYAADISRVYALKQPSERYKQVYNHVKDIQQELVRSLKPGSTMQDLEQLSLKLIQNSVKSLGLKNDVRSYYPHAVSHHLGLDVHDAADYTMPLKAGMVITIEPGLYISEEGIGVRIEDDVLITEAGARNLSENIPYDLLYYL